MKMEALNGAISSAGSVSFASETKTPAASSGAPLIAFKDLNERVSGGPAGIQNGPQDLGSFIAQQAIARSQQELAARGFAPSQGGVVAFTPAAVEVDSLNQIHVRMDRTVDGVKVFGDQVIVHLRNGIAGNDVLVTGQPLKIDGAAPFTSIDSGAALAAVAAKQELPTDTKVQKIAFMDKANKCQMGFLVTCTDLASEKPSKMTYIVNGSGQVTKQWDALPTLRTWNAPKQADAKAPQAAAEEPAAGAAADDKTLYSGVVALMTDQIAGTAKHKLTDASRGKGLETKDANNLWDGAAAKTFEDNNGKWGEASDSARQKAAVDAAYGAASTYDMYKEILGRDSIDGKGEKLVSNVHIGVQYVNAFWNGNDMNYGDGDNQDASFLTTLDIAGHEITHGLTERTAGLIYSDESGGLNESFSDVGGFLVEWLQAKKNPSLKYDWLMGEDCWTPGNGNDDALRYMNNPTKDGYSVDHYSKYPEQTEVHGSSGIANAAFYQLAEENNAGKIPNSVSKAVVKDGIGVEKAAKIWFRALITYMTPSTTFAQAREACLRAAEDLFGKGSVEMKKTAEAWAAVGVGKTLEA